MRALGWLLLLYYTVKWFFYICQHQSVSFSVLCSTIRTMRSEFNHHWKKKTATRRLAPTAIFMTIDRRWRRRRQRCNYFLWIVDGIFLFGSATARDQVNLITIQVPATVKDNNRSMAIIKLQGINDRYHCHPSIVVLSYLVVQQQPSIAQRILEEWMDGSPTIWP